MPDESRLVRDLLDANLKLTEQFLELARLAIGAPSAEHRDVNSYAVASGGPVPAPEFQLTTTDDWEDIPDRPMGSGAQTLEIPRRIEPADDLAFSDLPLHMSEEEEDTRHAVAFGLAPSSDLSDLLKRLHAPGGEVIEFIAPEQA